MKLPVYPFIVVKVLAGVVVAVPLDFIQDQKSIERFATIISIGAKRKVWLAMSDQLTFCFDVGGLGKVEFIGEEARSSLPTSELNADSQSLFLFVEQDKLPFSLT